MKVLVGCPISHRGWILARWFKHVEVACKEASVQPEYVFVVSERDDDTLVEIGDFLEANKFRPKVHVVYTSEPDRQDVRDWNPQRYHQMVDLRNLLLNKVRELNPDYFLSLDSDLLLAPDSLRLALDEIDDAAALGMCTYMTKCPMVPAGQETRWEVGRAFASKADQMVGNRVLGREHREGEAETHEVACIMAAKLMKPSAYNIDYQWHWYGEDAGWSKACFEEGLKLVWCPKSVVKHVYTPAWLDREDYRVGF